MRLFLAIQLPEDFKELLQNARLEIQRDNFKAEQHHLLHWVGKEQFHITQYYLGKVNEEIQPEVRNILARTIQSCPAFQLQPEELCFVASQNTFPRMIWLKFHLQEAFSLLSNNIYNALSAQLPELEKPRDPIIPHVTLIRLKKVKPIERKLKPLKMHSIHVKEIELWQSFLDSEGARYERVESFSLADSKDVQ